jgi:hypothetical protein
MWWFCRMLRAGYAAQASGQPNLVYGSARTHSPHNTNFYLEFEISISSTYSPTYSPTYAFLHAFLHTFLLDYAIFMPPDRRQRASRSPQPPQQTPQVFAAALRAKADRSVTAQAQLTIQLLITPLPSTTSLESQSRARST